MPVHPMAVVESGVRLGQDVDVGPFCYIQSGVEIGDGCRLGPSVTLFAHTRLGRNCQVHCGAVLGDLPQDFGFSGGESYVEIGDDCIIREGVTVHRGTKPGTQTTIGDRCMLMGYSHFAHNVQLGTDVIVVNGALLGGYVKVGNRAFISGNVGVHQFVQVGSLAMLGVGSSLTKDVPPFCTTRPSTENGVNGLNVVGMRRAGMDADARAAVKAAFKTLYLSGLNVQQAVAVIAGQACAPEVVKMLDFIRSSERGICACSISR